MPSALPAYDISGARRPNGNGNARLDGSPASPMSGNIVGNGNHRSGRPGA